MKKLSSRGAIDIYLVIAMILVVLVGVFALNRIQEADKTASDNEAASTTNLVVNEQVEKTDDGDEVKVSVPDGWVEYSNQALNVNFIFPESWGIVEETVGEIPEGVGGGKVLTLTFSDTQSIVISSATEDYHVGRGGGLTTRHHKGWTVEGNSVYLISNYAPGTETNEYSVLAEGAELTKNEANTEYVFEDLGASEFLSVDEHYVASFNLTDSEYRGLAAAFAVWQVEKDGVVADSNDFTRFIESIRTS